MRKQLTKIGNSKGFIIEQPILKLLNFKDEIDVEVTSDGKGLVIRPASESRVSKMERLSNEIADDYAPTFEELAK